MVLVDDPIWHRQLVLKCAFTFIIQIALTLIIWVETAEEGKIEIFTGDLYLNASRLMCSILLHMSIMPEVRTSLDMMKFALTSADKFKDKRNFIPYLIAIMKITGGLATEAINMLKMGQSFSVQAIVKDFIAFGIIAEIDDLIVHTIKGVDIEALMTSNRTQINFSTSAEKETFGKCLTDFFATVASCVKANKCLKYIKEVLLAASKVIFFALYKIVNLFYVGFYFYFGPLLIIVLVTAGGDQQLLNECHELA